MWIRGAQYSFAPSGLMPRTGLVSRNAPSERSASRGNAMVFGTHPLVDVPGVAPRRRGEAVNDRDERHCEILEGVIGRFVPRITVTTKNDLHSMRWIFSKLLFLRCRSALTLDRARSRPR